MFPWRCLSRSDRTMNFAKINFCIRYTVQRSLEGGPFEEAIFVVSQQNKDYCEIRKLWTAEEIIVRVRRLLKV